MANLVALVTFWMMTTQLLDGDHFLNCQIQPEMLPELFVNRGSGAWGVSPMLARFKMLDGKSLQ